MEHAEDKVEDETKGPDGGLQGTLPEEGKGEGGEEVEGAVNFSRQLPKPPPLGVGQVSADGKALIVAGDEAIAMSVLEDLRLGQRAQDDMARATRKRCTYAGCEKPDSSRCFYNVDEGKTAGGQDWSALVGHVLCHACYQRFNRSGTLERSTRRPVSKAVRRCTFHGCDRPEQSRCFYTIEEGRTAGGQEWGSLAGSVLCHACYQRFKRSGTLERTANKPLNETARRCTYEFCDRPDKSRQFTQIDESTTAGRQDWSSLVGNVLCVACYLRFKRNGTLERQERPPAQGRRARKPARKFARKDGEGIRGEGEEGGEGGEDGEGGGGWEGEDGARVRRDEEGGSSSGIKRERAEGGEGSSYSKRARVPSEKAGGKPSVKRLDMCILCQDETRRLCVVPCGHYGLCKACGDIKMFLRSRNTMHEPVTHCPACQEPVMEPYAMEVDDWEDLGGTPIPV